ncbi:MAG: flagellar hook capping FlgD N-terminal domain-containing protein [Candidatus Korobacteraceae bacterium]|jgi:flagellar hook assembly protein FlgD
MSISPVSPTAQANDSTTTNSSATSSATDYQSMFMQLLATELQSQDPTQTMDPTTMVTQMVQINQLSDVAGIYSILQGGGTTSTASGDATSAISGPTSNAVSAVAPATSQAANNILGGN